MMNVKHVFLKIVCLCLTAIMVFSLHGPAVIFDNASDNSLVAYAAWDGFRGDGGGAVSLLDFNSIGAVMDTGAQISTKFAEEGNMYSAHWSDHLIDTKFVVKNFAGNITSDWSDYTGMTMKIYSEKATGADIMIVISSPDAPDGISYFSSKFNVNWSGWKELSFVFSEFSVARTAAWENIIQLQLGGHGSWSINGNPETDLYISSINLEGVSLNYDFVSDFYGSEKTDKAFESLDGSVAFYAGASKAAQKDGVKEMAYAPDVRNGEVYVPASAFEEYLGASVDDNGKEFSITYAGKTLTATVDSHFVTLSGEATELRNVPYAENGMCFVSGEEIASLLGIPAFTDGKLLVMGTVEGYNALRRPAGRGVNELNEIIAYHISSDVPESDEITAQDRSMLIANWRRHLVGDSTTNDLSVENVAKRIKTIEDNGKAAWDALIKDTSSDRIFNGINFTSSASMTSAYGSVQNMTYAYATHGSKYYQNEELFKDIIYALDRIKSRCYSTEARAAWIISGFNNWHDWQIASPDRLVNILMCLEDKLSASQLKGYLEYFDTIMPSATGTAANFTHASQIVLGSAVLQGDNAKALKTLSKLQKEYLYADDNKRSVESYLTPRDFPVVELGSGFFTDGSYIFHTLHAMNSLYGIAQFRTLVLLEKLVDGTNYDIESAFKDNLTDFYYNSFEPVVFESTSYRSTMGRSGNKNNVTGGVDHNVLAYRFANALSDDETKKDIYSIVKDAYLSVDNTVRNTFINNMAMDEIAPFSAMIADEAVPQRENRRESKVYHIMDKTVHARDSWGFSLSMSSSRIFNYECINNENTDGWYTGDGMTEYYLSGSQMNGTTQYWSSLNKYRIPGTTVDTQKRQAVTITQGNGYLSTKDFVGGVELADGYSAAAMHLESYHADSPIGTAATGFNPAHKNDLTAKKAYFMLDDGFICLGSDINAKNNNNAEVLTIVDNPLSTVSHSVSDDTVMPYKIVSTVANQNPEVENPDVNSADENFGTKWAGKDGAEIVWDIGEVKPMGFASLSLQNGSKRHQYFELQLSSDGVVWESVFDGESGGKTEMNEPFDLKGKNARYVKFVNKGNSGGSAWVSITECQFYPPRADGKIGVEEAEIYGADPITVDGKVINLLGDDKVISGASWVNFNNQVGYFFPKNASVNGGELKCRWTKSAQSHFELWFSHGINPTNGGYAYVVLPGMTNEQTGRFALGNNISFIHNDGKIQAAKDNRTGITYIVFWEAGSACGITANQPCIVIMKETDSSFDISVSDPTQKLSSGKLIIEKSLKCTQSDEASKVTSDSTKTVLDISFAGSTGRTYAFNFEK